MTLSLEEVSSPAVTLVEIGQYNKPSNNYRDKNNNKTKNKNKDKKKSNNDNNNEATATSDTKQ